MTEEDTKLALEPQWRKKGLKLLFVALHIIRRVRRRGDGWTHYPCC
jgi:hypothetical protein